MGTKTIGLREEAYDRLKARKRDDESFTELVDRLLDETTADWREGFGTLDAAEMESLSRTVEDSRSQLGEGLTHRRQDALDEFDRNDEDVDETA